LRSLRWKLWGSLILIVVILVGLMAIVTNWNTSREFSRYVEESNTRLNEFVDDFLSDYYERNQGWNGLQDTIDESPFTGPFRLIVSDESGTIIGDTDAQLLGSQIPRANLRNSIEIMVSNQKVGNFILTSSYTKMGMMGRWSNIHPEPPPGLEQQFIDRSNSALWLTVLITLLIAIGIGTILTRQITRPVFALSQGARQIADGNLDYRVPVASKDELGKLADSFNDMAASLETSEESRRRFTADIAHELRTPLTIIEGTVNGIVDGVFDADREHLDTVKEQTGMLTRLINDLRDISLVEAGRLRLELAPTDILPLLERKIKQIEVAASTKNINLALNVSGEIPSVNIDSGRVEQVIANLLSNAIRYTPEAGSITVTVTTAAAGSTTGDSGQKVSITIADTGDGISPEHLEHVFDRFYRIDDARTRREGGTGLGLAIVRQIVLAHGGSVRAESETGKGSVFIVELPVDAL
jgi:signal transduction histidine kinase